MSGELLRAPNGALFTRRPGILPEMLAGFFEERAQARAAGDELAAFTCKIVMNSFYGVLATGSCRFAEGALAGAITGFGHYLLRWTRDLLEDGGRGTVLYGDTDSLFVDPHLPVDLSAASTPTSSGRELCGWLNERLADHVRERFDLPSYLDLEFEKYYARFFLPPMRGNAERGRAKGYAGLKVAADGSEEVEIIGMEAVRRDWTDLAHEVQRDLLERVFHDAPAAELEGARAGVGGRGAAGGAGTTTSCTARPCASRWTATPAPFPPTWPRRGCCRSRGARSATSSPATARSPPAA